MLSHRHLSPRFRTRKGIIGCLVNLLGCTLLGLAGMGAAQAAALNFRVEGLPTGLQVFARASFLCGSSNGSPTSGGAELVEDSYLTFDRVTLPSGIETIVNTVHTFYAGTVQIAAPSNNSCGAPPNGAFTYEYLVLGTNTAGGVTGRTVGTGGDVLSGTSINIRDTLRAQTTQINRNGSVPETMQMGVQQSLFTNHEDSAGGSAIRNPSLEITRQVNINGLLLNVSIARAVLNANNQICVTAGSESACRSRSLGGTVTAGVLTVNVAGTINKVGGKTRSVEWSININPRLGAGTFGLVAKADDFDSIPYFVGDTSQELDLLPWKSLRIPVTLF